MKKLLTGLLILGNLTTVLAATGELNSMKLKGPRANNMNPQVTGEVELCAWAGVLDENTHFSHEDYSFATDFPIYAANESVVETLVELVGQSKEMEVCGEGYYQETYGFAGRTLKVYLETVQ